VLAETTQLGKLFHTLTTLTEKLYFRKSYLTLNFFNGKFISSGFLTTYDIKKVGHGYKEEQFQWNNVYNRQTDESLSDYCKTEIG